MLPLIIKNNFVIAVLIFFLTFFVYFKGISPSVFGGDSGDIILSAWFGGIAHAPGYPLNAMIGWIFTHLPYHASVAFKANLMAAFFQSTVVFFTFLICKKLTKNTFVALAASLTLAFTTLFWLYAHIIEVFQLNLALVAASVYFLICWKDAEMSKKQNEIFLYLSALFLGLAVFHHQTSVLVLPAFIYLVLRTNKGLYKRKITLVKIFIAFSLGFLQYLYLPIASLNGAPTNWGDATSIINFLKIITRSEYGTFVASGQVLGTNLISRLLELLNYVFFIRSDFKILGSIFILVGCYYLYKKDEAIFWFVSIAIFFVGPFFLFYSSFPFVNDFFEGLWERFLLLSYFFLTLFLAFGFLAFYKFLKDFIKKTSFLKKQRIQNIVGLLSLLIFILPLNLYSTNNFKADMSSFHLGDWLGNDILSSAENNSIVFLLGDTQTFNTEYFYYTTDKYKSVKIVRAGSLTDVSYRKKLTRTHEELKFPLDFSNKSNKPGEYYVRELIEENKEKFPVYFYANPLEINNYRWMPTGLLEKLIPNDNYSGDELVKVNEDLFSHFAFRDFNMNFGYSQFMTTNLKESYYGVLIKLSEELIKNKKNEIAYYYLIQAKTLLPEAKDTYRILGNEFLAKKECEKANENYKKVFELDNKEWKALEAIAVVYNDCFNDRVSSETYFKKANELKNKSQDTLL